MLSTYTKVSEDQKPEQETELIMKQLRIILILVNGKMYNSNNLAKGDSRPNSLTLMRWMSSRPNALTPIEPRDNNVIRQAQNDINDMRKRLIHTRRRRVVPEWYMFVEFWYMITSPRYFTKKNEVGKQVGIGCVAPYQRHHTPTNISLRCWYTPEELIAYPIIVNLSRAWPIDKTNNFGSVKGLRVLNGICPCWRAFYKQKMVNNIQTKWVLP